MTYTLPLTSLLAACESDKPFTPYIEPFSCPAAHLKDLQVWVDSQCLPFDLLQIIVNIREQIEFVHYHHLRNREHLRILGRFIIAFGCAHNDNTRILPKVPCSWADQVADVLNHEQVHIRQLDFRERVANHMSFEVTCSPRINLDG